ncbi:MAG: PilC/PilY family type IV pilus protein [Formivibrio sp.]|nr:PilC/PilY family type IV pilus protein [Formivibrio sp.]
MKTITHVGSINLATRLFALALALTTGSGMAAVADLAPAPLANGTSGTTSIKPNIAMMIDDSGSMAWDYMPDTYNNNGLDTYRTSRCFGSPQFNGMAYNPTLSYKPPYKPDGTAYTDGVLRFPDSVFTAAKSDGYLGTGSTNLSTNSQLPNGPAAPNRYYYTTTSSTTAGCLADSSYTAITSSANIAAPGVANGSAAALTNYANWFSYYRIRVNMMKAAAAEAFSGLSGDRYRVGLFFLNGATSGSAVQNSTNVELKVDDFSGTVRSNWYTNLFNTVPNSGTPTRGALSRMGRMYAGQISGLDPVQYSCQQNFTIVSSDGYWNTSNEKSTYGPKQIDNSTDVGNTDGGPIAASSAQATITIGGNTTTTGCYRASSVKVNGVELLSNPPAPATCTTDRDTLGNAVKNSINANTGTTGYSASYASKVITIVAPTLAGNLSVSPSATFVQVSGSNSKLRTFTTSAFSGYVAGTTGTALPYRDALNISNTLADIAYYYYNTDLRTTALNNCSNTIGTTLFSNLCDNNVLGTTKDNQQQQHMTTFTIGLGLSDQIYYQNNYETAGLVAGKTTYTDILNGTANWPNPDPTNTNNSTGVPGRVDDLWHAAVNGHGTYFSATDPSSLALGVTNALAAIQSRTGTSSAAATSNLEPVSGDNYVFLAQYTTVKWVGDVKTLTIDPVTGDISSTPIWSAQSMLDSKVAAAGAGNDGRTIKYFNNAATATNKLKDFTYANLSADAYGGYFTNTCLDASPKLSQCGTTSGFSSAQKTVVNTGDNMVKYLRGQSTYEMQNTNTAVNRLLRARDHVLGDIVNSAPVYVSKPPFSYGTNDATYTDYVTANSSRDGSVYVAANDGMLHALKASDGSERWAYVPTAIMSNMYMMASANYDQNHQYYVDGTPTVADICVNPVTTGTGNRPCSASTDWRTIIVGGFNKGGRGYYALDVTDPANPKGLWEFSETDLGYTFGNPVITRRKDGKWVVLVTSGYNNVPDGTGATGDGNGHLYVLDAVTGTVLDKITTGTAGSVSTPSGLGKINAWVADPTLNTASVAYGADLLGNVWRFDFDDNYAPAGKEAMLLANLAVSGTPQSITTKPVLAYIISGGITHNMVLVGTGRYLGLSDPANTDQQSIYAIEDKLTNTTGIGDARTSNMLVQRTMTQSTVNGNLIRTVSGANIDWTTKRGWYIDLNPGSNSPGERVNVDMDLQYNMLTVASNVPDTNACNVGGYAWLYGIDIDTGENLSTAEDSAIGFRLSTNALAAGIKVIWIGGKPKVIVTNATGNPTVENAAQPTAQYNKPRRTMWREIFD